PQVSLDADVRPGDDQRALSHADALGNRQARRVRGVFHQTDGAGGGLLPREAAAKAGDPLARDRQVVPQDLAGAVVTLLAVLRVDRDLRDAIRHLVGTD